jgi:hypothetical protein
MREGRFHVFGFAKSMASRKRVPVQVRRTVQEMHPLDGRA